MLQAATQRSPGPEAAQEPHHIEAVNVVDVPVLPAPVVPGVLEHGDLRAIEHRRFIHVVPDKEV